MSQGMVFIHHAPLSLLAHIEWTIAGVSGNPITINWKPSALSDAGYRSDLAWEATADSGAVLAAAFRNLKQVCFEIIQYPAQGDTGYRWSYTPTLGMFHCATDAAGNLLIGENQIRSAMEQAGSNPLKLQAQLRKLLGQAFDDELEEYRELVGGAEGHNGVMTAEAERVAYRQNVGPS
jgi:hypothetical protein